MRSTSARLSIDRHSSTSVCVCASHTALGVKVWKNASTSNIT
ncbi:Uncharacterised protein [Bordetella pertussis]|nr:Uncharacterised protein [Bordetella pertussis]CFO77144.1 Uncharacterised protein [Bordetella pertussis]CFU87501.1 Uncharacterised protein [Bordetella pertussis]CPL00874.1 Uncharacterised protein [Bordetella pertussis]CPL70700.1 Uncharacterised protein [Bordetella pertussis]